MDGTIVVFIALGLALVVVIIALILYKPAGKEDQPPKSAGRASTACTQRSTASHPILRVITSENRRENV